MARSLLTRRKFLAGGGVLILSASLGMLGGCGEDEDSEQDGNYKTGLSTDTQIKEGPVTIKVLADSNLEQSKEQGIGRVEALFTEYQSLTGRGDVTFKIKYIDSVSMAVQLMSELEDECDAVIGLSDTIDVGVQAEILYGGSGGTSVRSLSGALNERLVIVRAKGSSVDMPMAETLTGEDADDGSITKIQSLPNFDGKIAVASDAFIEGVLANKMLYRNGLYSESNGMLGEYDSSLADIIVVYDNIDKLAQAVASGECGLGMMLQSSLWFEHTGFEIVYKPDYSRTIYKGASVTASTEGGVARDFLEYVAEKV